MEQSTSRVALGLHIVAGLMIHHKTGKILFEVNKGSTPISLQIPYGLNKEGESLQGGILREVLEKTGQKVAQSQVHLLCNRNYNNLGTCHLFSCLIKKDFSGFRKSPIWNNSNNLYLKAFLPEEIAGFSMYSWQREMINMSLKEIGSKERI